MQTTLAKTDQQKYILLHHQQFLGLDNWVEEKETMKTLGQTIKETIWRNYWDF